MDRHTHRNAITKTLAEMLAPILPQRLLEQIRPVFLLGVPFARARLLRNQMTPPPISAPEH
jgi:hypothetical protein